MQSTTAAPDTSPPDGPDGAPSPADVAAAADRLTAAVVALLGRTSDRGVIASEGVSVSTWLRVFARRTVADERMLTATVERLADLPTVHRWFTEGLLSWPTRCGVAGSVSTRTG